MIVTTTPRLWNRVLAPSSPLWDNEVSEKPTQILDVSTLLGQTDTPSLLASDVVTQVVDQLVQAGWPRKSIVTQYQADLKSRFTTDVAVFGPDNSWQLAIEVKQRDYRLNQSLLAKVDYLRNRTAANWLCVTDGSRFHLISRETNEQRVAYQVPSPSEVGADISSVEVPRPASSLAYTLRPSSVEELWTSVMQYRPEAVILDPTLLHRAGTQESTNLTLLAIVDLIEDLLPSDTRLRPRQHFQPWTLSTERVFGAWASTLPSVKALSTVATAHLATSPSERWLREYLSNRLQLCAVIELPRHVFRKSAPSDNSILYFGGERDEIYFDALTSRSDLIRPESRPWYESLSGWMKDKEAYTGYTTSGKLPSIWSYAANDPEISRIIQRLQRLGEEIVSLGELCQIYRIGGPYKGREVTDQGASERIASEVDDIILSERGPEHGTVLASRVIEPGKLPRGTLILRLPDSRVSSDYLLEYLNSSTARKLIAAKSVKSTTGWLHRISVEHLREIPVPLLRYTSFESLCRIGQIEEELRSKAEEVESLRRSLFEAEDASMFQLRLGSLVRRGRMLSKSLELVERLEYEIANFYPFPLAYGYRLLTSYVEPEKLHREQLRIAENMLAFLASISLAILQKQDYQEAGINLTRFWRGGTSFGGWRMLISRCAKVFQTYENHPLASAIQGLNIESEEEGFGADIAALRDIRDDYHHGRTSVAEEDIVRASKETQERLKRCMEALAFFTEYPIRRVQDVDISRYQAEAILKCLIYRGDHPGLEQEELVFPTALTRGDLFIELSQGKWYPLYPFLSVQTCPTCRTSETYFVDRWNRQQGATNLKSFERGHTETSKEISRDLEVS